MARLLSVAATDVGLVRPMNEDRFLVEEDLVAVADGMGGHVGGEVAASIAIDALGRAFSKDRTAAGLVLSASAANRAVISEADANRALRGMGTTLTAAALVGGTGHEEIVVVNVGDSRAYLFDSDELVRLTDDHSLAEEMVRSGEITAEEAASHPHRHILTRVLGIDPSIEVDSWIISPRSSMRFLLCSDGLTNECSEGEIAHLLRQHPDRQQAADALVSAAVEHGGNDNVTVVIADVIEVEGDDEGPRILGAALARPVHQPLARGSGPARPTSAGGARRRIGERLLTLRAAIFTIVLALVIGGSFGAIDWFNSATYFVKLHAGHVAIYQGRPGGLLYLRPRLVTTTKLSAQEVLSENLPRLRAGIIETSYGDALGVVHSLAKEKSVLGLSGTPATTQATTGKVTTTTKAGGA